VPHQQAGDMTAPDPQSSIIIQDHIAKRAPSRHDITTAEFTLQRFMLGKPWPRIPSKASVTVDAVA
jgi:hypothetical protein